MNSHFDTVISLLLCPASAMLMAAFGKVLIDQARPFHIPVMLQVATGLVMLVSGWRVFASIDMVELVILTRLVSRRTDESQEL